jgi:OFA family oxalate/formate antiporter-like MFS transporter
MKTRKILIVIAGMAMLLCLGLIYAWSIFVAPLEAEFGWTRQQTSLTFTISMAMFCLGSLAGGMLGVKKARRLLLLVVSGIIIFIGFNAASTSTELVHFYIYYGVLCGTGVGLSYNIIISSITKLFPQNQGFISGVLMMSFGFGGLILGAVCTSLLLSYGWRSTFKLIALSIGGIVVLGAVIIEFASKGINPETEVAKAKAKGQSAGSNTIAPRRDYSPAEVIKDGTFQIFYLWLVLLSASGLMIIGHIAPCVLELGAAPATAALAVGTFSVFNGVGRVLLGISYDKIGMHKTLWTNSLTLLAAGIVLSVSLLIVSLPLLLFGCALMGFSYGGCPVSTSAVVNKLYGSKYFSSNFSLGVTCLLIAALIGPTLASALKTSSGSYQTSFYVLILMGLLTNLTCIFLTKKIKVFVAKMQVS